MTTICYCKLGGPGTHNKTDACLYPVCEQEGSIATFNSGSTRSAEPLEDPEGFLSPFVIDVYNDYMARNRTQADGKVRNSDNWQKGMPKARYMRALWRHFLEAWRLWRSEDIPSNLMLDALFGVMFNVHGMILEVLITRADIKRPIIRSEDVPKQQ